MSKEVRLAKTAILYAIGNFATKILNFIFVPIYTYYVSTADMGDFDLYTSVVWMIQPLAVMQIQDGMFRWILGREGEKSDILATGYQYILKGLLMTNVIYLVVVYFIHFEYPLIFMLLSTLFQ